MEDYLLNMLENLYIWIQKNPFTTLIVVIIILAAVYGLNKIVSYLKDQ